MDHLTASQYKAYANDIVGIWYNEVPDEVLVFSFLFDFTQQSDLLIIDKGKWLKVTYSILDMQDGEWLLVIWNEEVNKIMFYQIELLSPDALVITSNNLEVKVYQRKIDHAFVHDILKEIQ